MEHQSEAQNVAQDAQCGNLSSGPAKRAIAKLRAMPPDAKAQRVVAYAEQDCGSLIRCALAAGGCAGARDEEGEPVRSIGLRAWARLAASRRCWTAAQMPTRQIHWVTRRRWLR